MPTIGIDIATAAARLRNGGLVAFATETVYGLGADAKNPEAVERLYALKNRPRTHPVIIHLADFSEASQWAATIPFIAQQLATVFMPGPLTLLLPAGAAAKHTTGGGDAVALRVPGHLPARQLLSTVGGGVVAPSANRFGYISPTAAVHVQQEFADTADLYILDGGRCQVGIESTIVSCMQERLSVVRPGKITAAEIAAVTGDTLLPPAESTPAPGCFPRHYAPVTPLLLAANVNWHNPPASTIAALSRQCPAAVPNHLWRQAATTVDDYTHQLYALLRELDGLHADFIWVELPPVEWGAVHDRLKRAATPSV